MATTTTTNGASTNGDKPEIILYTNHACPWAHRAHIALNELGVDFKEEIIDLDRPRDPWYLKVNPVCLVLCLCIFVLRGYVYVALVHGAAVYRSRVCVCVYVFVREFVLWSMAGRSGALQRVVCRRPQEQQHDESVESGNSLSDGKRLCPFADEHCSTGLFVCLCILQAHILISTCPRQAPCLFVPCPYALSLSLNPWIQPKKHKHLTEHTRIQRGLVPSISYNGTILSESAVVTQFLADAYDSHLLPPSTGSVETAIFRARVAYFVDSFISKVLPPFFAGFRAQEAEEKDKAADDLVAAVVKEVEPLFDWDTKKGVFFGGSEKPTLAEVGSPLSSPVVTGSWCSGSVCIPSRGTLLPPLFLALVLIARGYVFRWEFFSLTMCSIRRISRSKQVRSCFDS